MRRYATTHPDPHKTTAPIRYTLTSQHKSAHTYNKAPEPWNSQTSRVLSQALHRVPCLVGSWTPRRGNPCASRLRASASGCSPCRSVCIRVCGTF
ncbi:hypothetical protein BJY04DRAFT_194297 [Aspergillus karnatakaensis]|uniref:uncharacterized protein n=1 Tax=Aspergillus karnatakaensis TaxID=1810916 RepID=UPI003CCE0A78